MTITRHPVDIEPEVRALVDDLVETREYAVTRDLTVHEITRQGDGDQPVVFYDAISGREVGLAFGEHLRLEPIGVRHLRAAVRDEQTDAATARTIDSLNTAARTRRLAAGLLAAHDALVTAERAVEQARTRRDELVRQVAATGVTPYRIAKNLGVAESTIGRIIASGAR